MNLKNTACVDEALVEVCVDEAQVEACGNEALIDACLDNNLDAQSITIDCKAGSLGPLDSR